MVDPFDRATVWALPPMAAPSRAVGWAAFAQLAAGGDPAAVRRAYRAIPALAPRAEYERVAEGLVAGGRKSAAAAVAPPSEEGWGTTLETARGGLEY